jgi:hypothetical protein
MNKHEKVNHSNQLNPNNEAYWEVRGWDRRPNDWEERAARGEATKPRSGYQSTPNNINQLTPYRSSFEEWFGKAATNPRYSNIDDDDE